jgi:hypothetical protein
MVMLPDVFPGGELRCESGAAVPVLRAAGGDTAACESEEWAPGQAALCLMLLRISCGRSSLVVLSQFSVSQLRDTNLTN